MSKHKIPSRITAWWQSMQRKTQSPRQWTHEHVEELHHKQESYGDTIVPHKEIEGRITMFTAIRIIMAELGDPEYWRTLWQMFWRPGYVMSDFINGKGRHYLKPFQLLIGTTMLLAIALAIVPAKMAKGESLEVGLESQLAERTLTPEAQSIVIPVRTCVKYLEKYRLFKEEHTTYTLLATFFLPVIFTWLLFRKSSRRPNPFVAVKENQANYNFPEMVTIEIFVAAQLQLVNTIWVLMVGWIQPTLYLDPFVFPGFVVLIVMFIDYQQLFGRKWYDTLWRTFLCALLCAI